MPTSRIPRDWRSPESATSRSSRAALLLDSTSNAGIGATERAAADLLCLAAVPLEASLGYYRSLAFFPDSYGAGTLEAQRDANTYEWLQSVLRDCAE